MIPEAILGGDDTGESIYATMLPVMMKHRSRSGESCCFLK